MDQWMVSPLLHQSVHRLTHSSTGPSSTHPPIHTSTHPVVHLVTHPLIHWSTHPLVRSSTNPLVPHPHIHLSTHPLIHPCTDALSHWSTDPLIHSSTDPLIHWFTGPLVHWSTGPFIHSSISSPNRSNQYLPIIACEQYMVRKVNTYTQTLTSYHPINAHPQMGNLWTGDLSWVCPFVTINSNSKN